MPPAAMPTRPPVFFVERTPLPGSPAALAGLKAGDAVLTFGEAQSIEEVAALLRPGARIAARVMGRNGVVQDRVVAPKSFDPNKPHSLLGCQITDICPIRFTPHPAMRGLAPEPPSAAPEAAEPEPEQPAVRSANVVESVAFLKQLSQPHWHEDTAKPANGDEESGIGEDGSSSSDDQEEPQKPPVQVTKVTPLRTASDKRAVGSSSKDRGSTAALVDDRCPFARWRWRSRCMLLAASLLNLGHGCAFLAAPTLGSETAAVVAAFRSDLWRLASTACIAGAQPVAGDDEEGEQRFRRWLLEDDDDARPSTGGVPLSHPSDTFDGEFDEVAADASLTFHAFVRVALLVASLQLVLTAAGVALALLPADGVSASGGRGLSDTLLVRGLRRCAKRLSCVLGFVYPPAALLLWLLLAGATMYCVAFRFEADDLLRRYWDCLQPESGPRGDRLGGARAFESVVTVAVVCATADLSAVLGLFAACSLIGWRVVLRASMMVFGVLSAIGGGLLASFGSVLLNAADESAAALPGMAARGLILIGVAMCPLGILGTLAAKREQTALLQLHSVMLSVLSLALAALCVFLLVGGAEALRPSLERMVGDEPDRVENDVDRIVSLLQNHRLGLSAASVLGLFLLAMNGTMAIGLRWIVSGHIDLTDEAREHTRRAGIAPVEEKSGLLEEEDEEDEDGDLNEWPEEWEDVDGSAAS